jgi:hypothetical protein
LHNHRGLVVVLLFLLFRSCCIFGPCWTLLPSLLSLCLAQPFLHIVRLLFFALIHACTRST